MKKKGRGTSAEYIDKGNSVVISAWYDSRQVLIISNFLGVEPQDKASHFDKKAKKVIQVPRPRNVEACNKFMGGVDKADMFLSLYRSQIRSRKWYIRIAFHLLQLSAVDAFSISNEIGRNGAYLDFLVDICRCLCAATDAGSDSDDGENVVITNRSLSANDVPKKISLDRINHWPPQLQTQRCKYPDCKRRTTFKCSKCDIYLCVNGSDCFLQFHSEL